MVKNCLVTNYPLDSEEKYKEHFEQFKYPLHIFQKWAIEGIVEGNHVLVTAPTGSGKSLPAEFALDFFVKQGKKVVYCSPIKSLSNQKFYDFSQKYPHITVGLITGDIKTNPDANVLIMTTEILLNKLYQIKSNSPQLKSATSFDMDIQNELGCVIFDEIHMINDYDRGTVWENSIMLLPRHIQLIGLSATLSDPEKFAYWLENRGERENVSKKIVYLAKKFDRAVPLTHYSFITTNQGIFKAVKDKTTQEEIRKLIDKPIIIQDAKGVFNDVNYLNMNKMLKLFEAKEVRVKRSHVLNKVSEYLVEKEMLPAICYVLSRKQLEKCAHEITANLLEFDSKIPYTIDRECEQIIRKLPNYEEYLHLPEYLDMVQLLRKGVAMHHSGLMPILREIVEILFSKGYIKLLFATESVAIGLNLPVKTCIFTDIYKHDGNNLRVLQGHEFVQASGRAGRLGLDTVGHVIHLNNLFRNIDTVSYKQMMKGAPQTLVSKFKLSFNLLLNLIDIDNTNNTNNDNNEGNENIVNFARKSMVTDDLNNQLKEVTNKIDILNADLLPIKNSLPHLRTPQGTIEEYIELQEKKPFSVNKKRKEIERQIQNITETYKYIEQDKLTIQRLLAKEKELIELQLQFNGVSKYINNNVQSILYFLQSEEFIVKNETDTDTDTVNVSLKLSLKGQMATHLREIHCLVFATLFDQNMIDSLSSRQLVALFSCFTNVNVPDDFKDNVPKSDDKITQNIVLKVKEMYSDYQNKEFEYNINTGADYNIHFDLMNYITRWCDCENVTDCKLILQQLGEEKEIFLGEFVKALLKINNISNEMEKIAELTGNIQFLSTLREIPNMTLKYVVTNQSLYV